MDDTIEIKPESNIEVKLHGDLVASKTDKIDEVLMGLIYSQKPSYFIVNMANVEMVDSSGISLLLTLINLSNNIYDLFIRMRIDKHIPMKKQ